MMVIRKLPRWCQEATEGLSETFGHDFEAIRDGVNAGRLELFRCWDGAAYMVTRIDRGVLTVCCYQGERARDTARWLRARCVAKGVKAMVFYTHRPALARLLHEHGFRPQQVVYRAQVA